MSEHNSPHHITKEQAHLQDLEEADFLRQLADSPEATPQDRAFALEGLVRVDYEIEKNMHERRN